MIAKRFLPVLLLLSTLVAANGCRSGVQEARPHGQIALYSAFISGGDAPLADTLAVFEDGWARYHIVGGRPHWVRLGGPAFARVEAARAALLPLMPVEPTSRVCCDAPELVIDLAKAPSTLDQIEFKQLIVYPGKNKSNPQLEQFVILRNELTHLVGGRSSLKVRWPGTGGT